MTTSAKLAEDPFFLKVVEESVLTVMGPETVVTTKLLAAALTDQDALVRAGAAQTLGQIGPAANPAVPALIARLKDEDQSVRAGAREALKKIDILLP